MNFKMNTMNCVFLIVVTYIALCFCKAPFAGPFDVVFRSAFKCSNDTHAFKYRMRISRLNRTHLIYNDTVSGDTGIKDTMTVIIDLSVFGNGGWKENFMHAEFPKACTTIQKYCPEMAKTILRAAGKEFTGCPIPPGSYYIKDWLFDLNVVLPTFPYGKYRVIVKVFENDTMLTCFGGEGEAVPKEYGTIRKKH